MALASKSGETVDFTAPTKRCPCILDRKVPGRLRGVRRITRRSSLPCERPWASNRCHGLAAMYRRTIVLGKAVGALRPAGQQTCRSLYGDGPPAFLPLIVECLRSPFSRVNLHDKGDRTKRKVGRPET